MSNVTKQNLEVLKKSIAVLTMTATVLSLIAGVVSLPSRASAATPSDYGLKEGDVVSAAGSDDPDVYIVNELGYKRLFLNPAIFGFYGHLGGFAAVKNVSAVTRDAFPTSGLFRNCEAGDEKVYGVETTGEDTGMLHWVNTSGAQAVADDPNFFKKVFCINNNEFNWYSKGSDYTSVNQVPNYVRGGQQQSGSLSVSLASDNPVASTLVAGQAIADLAHFQFSGSGTVTKLVFRRIGVSADTTLSNVYLFDGAQRLTDSSTVTSGLVNFNNPGGLFTVSGSKVLKVKSDIATGTSGQTLGLRLESYTMGGQAYTVSVSGNIHTVATATLATADYASSTTPSAATINPQDDYVMWQNTVTIGTRYVWLKAIRLRQVGSVLSNDLVNFRLYADGVQVGSAVGSLDANGYVNFDLSATPVKLETGGRIIKMLGNIVGGSNRNFSFSLQTAGDSELVDNEYGVAVLPTANAATFSARTSGTQTVDVGTLTFTKLNSSPTGDVVKDGSGIALGKWEVKAAGEKMKVEKLRFGVTYAPLGVTGAQAAFTLRNGAVFWNGVQIGSTASLCSSGDASCSGYSAASSASYTEYSFGSSMIVEPGMPGILEIRADIYDNDGTNNVAATDTLIAHLTALSSVNNVQRLTSLGYLDAPSAVNSANTLTVRTGSITLEKYTAYANQNVTVPNSSVKLGEYVLTGNSSEDVNVTSFNVAFDGNDEFDAADLTDVYLKVRKSDGSTVLQSNSKATVSTTEDQASVSYSVNFNLPKSTAYNIQVWGAISSFTVAGANDTMITDMDVTGTAVQSATTTTAHLAASGALVGQTLTAAAGSITSAVAGSTPSAKIAVGGTTVTALALDFAASNDTFTIHQLDFDMANSNTQNVVSYVIVKDGSTQIGKLPLNGASVSFTGLSVSVPNNTTKTLTAELELGNVGVGFASSAYNAALSLDRFKARDSAGTETNSATERNGNAIYVHKSYPSVAAVALPTTVLAAGQQTISKFTVSANGNTVGIKKFYWEITKPGASSVASASDADFVLLEDGVNVQADGDVTHFLLGEATASIAFEFTTEKQISSGTPKTYELKVNISGTLASGDSFVTQIKANTSSAGSALEYVDQEIATDAIGSLVWTDRSGTGTTAHSETTGDWFNDYLIQSAISQALTK